MSSSLFNTESTITLNNININEINLNSKSLIYSIYKDLTINNLEISNIKCTGDSGESSLILFESGEASHKMDLSNLYIRECVSNGPLIRIIGNTNEIYVKDSRIKYNESYGPIIKNTSLNVK